MAKTAPKKERITKIITGKYELTEKELSIAGGELADALEKKQNLQDELKLKASEYKDLISVEEDKIKKLSDKLRTGEEDRDYECEVIKDEEKKVKIFRDIKSKKVIKTAPFTAQDYQLSLDDVEEDLLANDDKSSKNGAKNSKTDKKNSTEGKKSPELYKFQTGDWVKEPVGKAFQLKIGDMGKLHKKLRLATADEIREAGGKPKSEGITPSKGGKGYSHSSVLGEKD